MRDAKRTHIESNRSESFNYLSPNAIYSFFCVVRCRTSVVTNLTRRESGRQYVRMCFLPMNVRGRDQSARASIILPRVVVYHFQPAENRWSSVERPLMPMSLAFTGGRLEEDLSLISSWNHGLDGRKARPPAEILQKLAWQRRKSRHCMAYINSFNTGKTLLLFPK